MRDVATYAEILEFAWAYVRVPQQGLLANMIRYGFNRKLLRLLEAVYECPKAPFELVILDHVHLSIRLE